MNQPPQNENDAGEMDSLRAALEAETERCLALQRRLETANRSFSDFISLAAHDMREALREVDSFSQLMAETHSGDLDRDTGTCIKHIRNGVMDVRTLLGAMLAYWSMDLVNQDRCPMAMDGVLNQAIQCCEQEISARGAVVTYDPLPVVSGHFELLTKVLHHLIRNGIEYSGVPVPRIHISSKRVGPEWVFSVTDNGPGIEHEFHDHLFRVFKRLHGKEYPGNGLGLAFCKKAIECLGGRMWLESEPGAGSSFLFTLAAPD